LLEQGVERVKMKDEATERSRQLWDSIADGWDKERASINEMESPVTSQMIDGLAVQAGDMILELYAGPGEVGLSLAGAVSRCSYDCLG
jgi:hypothetical protein